MFPGFLKEDGITVLREDSSGHIVPPDESLLLGVREFGFVKERQVHLPNKGGRKRTGDSRRRLRLASMGDGAMVVGAYMLHLAVFREVIPVGYVCRDTAVVVCYPGCQYQPWRYVMPEELRRDATGHLYYYAVYFMDAGNLQIAVSNECRLVRFSKGETVVLGSGSLYGGAGYCGDEPHVAVQSFFAWSGPGLVPRLSFFDRSVELDAEEDAECYREAIMFGSVPSSIYKR